MMTFVDFKLGNIRCMFGSSLSNQQEGGRDDLDGNLDHEIRKRGGFGGAKGRGGGEVDDDDDDDNDSVEKAAGAHNTRPGGRAAPPPLAAYLLAKTQSILRKIRFPER